MVEGEPAVRPWLADVTKIVALAGEMKKDVPLFYPVRFVAKEDVSAAFGDPEKLGKPFLDGRIDKGRRKKLIVADRANGEWQVPGGSQVIDPEENLTFVSGQGGYALNPGEKCQMRGERIGIREQAWRYKRAEFPVGSDNERWRDF